MSVHMPTSFAPGPAEPPVRGRGGQTYTPSSFGAALTTFGPGFRVNEIFGGPRFQELEHRERFFQSRQHDAKIFDFNGRMIRPGSLSTQPLIGPSLPTFYVPLDQRRPCDPYRLSKLIVTSFTGLIFGEGMWPEVQVVGDPTTQDFAEALVEAMGLRAAMIRARNIGGSTGTVGLSWHFHEGVPRVRVHRPQFLHVHAWDDFAELIPAHVTKLTQVEGMVWDRKKKAEVPMLFWHREDWTTEADLVFHDEPVGEECPSWTIDEEASTFHGDGFAHFVWIQNLPPNEEGEVDGEPDYDGLYDNMMSIDTTASVTSRGAALNLDPTLKLKMDPEIVKRYGVKKGSDNALVVGKDGDADYMELGGSSIAIGNELVDKRRAHILEVAQCVAPDPNVIAAAGTSSLAIRLIYRPMLAKGDVLREHYGRGVCRLISQQIESARRLVQANEGTEGEALPPLDLPPRVVSEDEIDDDTGEPTGDVTITFEDRVPGSGGDVSLSWPAYFPRTPAEIQQELTTFSAAAGGKPVLSHKTAARLAASVVGVDPVAEWEQISREQMAARTNENEMFPGIGGEVSDEAELPPGVEEETAGPTGPSLVDELSAPRPVDQALAERALEIVKSVQAGEIPRDAGMAQLQILLDLDPETAARLMGSAGTPTPESSSADA